jgi:hypothetical protein
MAWRGRPGLSVVLRADTCGEHPRHQHLKFRLPKFGEDSTYTRWPNVVQDEAAL